MSLSAPASLKRAQAQSRGQNHDPISGADSPAPDDIIRACQSLGLTQTAAAALIGAQLRTWQRWEAGTTPMNPALWRLWRHVSGLERIPYRAAPHK